jgi:hypothetical protein
VALNIQTRICSQKVTRTWWTSALRHCVTVAAGWHSERSDVREQLPQHAASTGLPYIAAAATGVLNNRHFTTHHIHCCWRYGKFKNCLEAATSVQREYKPVALSQVLPSAVRLVKLIYNFLWLCSPARAMAFSYHEVSWSHTTTRHSR